LKNDFLIAITQVCAERHLPKEVVLDAIEQALVVAYKRNFGTGQNIEVTIDPNTGKAHVFSDVEVVEEVKDRHAQASLQDARQVDPMANVGGTVRLEMTP
jgi:N utilization substance protein A